MSKFSFIALALVAGLSFPGCAKQGTGTKTGPTASGSADTRDPAAPVAKINGQVITEKELGAETKGPLGQMEAEYHERVYQARKQALDELIGKRLLEAKAKTEGITTDALVEREVTGKLAAPTDAELQGIYDQTKASGRPLPPFEQIKGDIARFVKEQKSTQVRTEYMDKLKKEAKVEVLLPPLLLPKVEVAAVGPSKGDPKAPITIVEFSDFECPFCGRAEPAIRRVLDEYKGKVRLVYRDYPLPFHAKAQKASEAALCADDQGKYWDMHQKLFDNQQALEVPQLKEYARGLGLDAGKFDACLDQGAKAKTIDVSKKDGAAIGVNGTPAFFINGRPLSGAQPFEKFKEIIDAELVASSR